MASIACNLIRREPHYQDIFNPGYQDSQNISLRELTTEILENLIGSTSSFKMRKASEFFSIERDNLKTQA